MEVVVIVAVVIGIAWFAAPKLAARRRAEDDAYANGGFGMGMLSWLPAWMITGGAMRGDGDPGDASPLGHDVGSDWSGSAGGGSGGFGGGGDIGGGGFGGN